MRLAKQHDIKVVLDGQGADELFAGYHHHFIARWNQLFSEGKSAQACKEFLNFGKSIPVPLLFYFKEKIKQGWDPRPTPAAKLLSKDFIATRSAAHGAIYFDRLNDQLADDITRTRLKIFLKCEDRAGMWHSVESRTPFSDDLPLIEAAFSFDGKRKIKNGVSKYFLREATRAFLPEEIYTRYDKIGFETPMNKWIKALWPQLKEEIAGANFDFVTKKGLAEMNHFDERSSAMVFKLFVLARWQKIFQA
jgi:asparagine synthase (glutamine-hydrolysing)